MSQVPGGPIGEARIDFVANTAPLKAGAEEAKTATVAAVGSMEESTKKATGAFGELRSTIRSLRGAIGTVAALGTAFDRLLRGVQAYRNAAKELADGFREIQSSGEAFRSLVEGGGDEIDRAFRAANERLDQNLQEINKKYEERWNGLIRSIESGIEKLTRELTGAEDPLALQTEEVTRLRGEYVKLAESLRKVKEENEFLAVRAKADELEQAERLNRQNAYLELQEELRAEIAGIRRDELDEEDRINDALAERLKKVDVLREWYEGLGDKAGLRIIEGFERAFRDAATRALEDAAKAAGKVLRGELAAIQRSILQSFDTNHIVTELQEVRKVIENIARNARNMSN